MRRGWAWVLVLAAVTAAAACGRTSPRPPCNGPGACPCQGPDCQPALLAGGGDWPQYRHDASGTFANPGTFAAADAARLQVSWTYDLGGPAYAEPIVTADTVYLTRAQFGRVVALDLATGRERWTRDLETPIGSTCGGSHHVGIWGSAALSGDTLYVAAPDGALHALAAADGSSRWSAAVAAPSPDGEMIATAPAWSTSGIFLGVAASAMCQPVAGRVARVDGSTHAMTEQPLVGDGQRGASVWASLAVDEDLGVAFAASGNPSGPLSAEPLAQSIVALDVGTLAVRDHWQNPCALRDCDFGAAPTLVDASAAGGTARLLAAVSKDGWLYVFKRGALSAGPAWKYQLAVGDPSTPDVAGDPLKGYGTIVPATYSRSVLYAGGGRTPSGDAGSVVAFDPATGAVRFVHATPGAVLAGMPAVGDVLLVASNASGNGSSTLEVLDAGSGAVLATFPGSGASFAAPALGHGAVVWATADGRVTALALPR